MERPSSTPETAINDHINELFTLSQTYISLYAYFDQDNVALRGFAKFFKDLSDREREHAMKLMKYQNTRGSRVKLSCIEVPASDFENSEKGEAIFAMELTLYLEKRSHERLINLIGVAARHNDPGMLGYIDREFLAEKVKDISTAAEYTSQLKMLGKGPGLWTFDQKLLHQG